MTQIEQLINRIDKEIKQKEKLSEMDHKNQEYYRGCLAMLRYIKSMASILNFENNGNDTGQL